MRQVEACPIVSLLACATTAGALVSALIRGFARITLLHRRRGCRRDAGPSLGERASEETISAALRKFARLDVMSPKRIRVNRVIRGS
jgi:hypothetical protein